MMLEGSVVIFCSGRSLLFSLYYVKINFRLAMVKPNAKR